jgi:hypothetical protein
VNITPEVRALIQAAADLQKHCEGVNNAFYVVGKHKAMLAAMNGQKERLQAIRTALAPFAESSPEPLRIDPEAPFKAQAEEGEGCCCPVCGKHDSEGDSWEFAAGMVWQTVTCLDCGSSWDENYTFRDITDVLNMIEQDKADEISQPTES